MKIIEPYAEIIGDVDGDKILKHIELCGRVCYKSEKLITKASAKSFVENIIRRGHESVLEHASVTVRFVVDRGVSHEIVRHRIASYSQESTRYCNYSKDGFGREITVIRPIFWKDDPEKYNLWFKSMKYIEEMYIQMIHAGANPQEARSVLTNSLKTELFMTANLREWRHFFKLRTASAAHPQMRQVTIPLLQKFKELIPVVFDDINPAEPDFYKFDPKRG